MSYSLDLRERVISYIGEGGKKSTASKLFKISRSTIDEWLLRKKVRGHLNPDEYYRPGKIDSKKLINYVKIHSDVLQKECAKKFNVTQTGISKAFKRLKITQKKRQVSTKNGMK